jgi:hypothetical protein
MQNQNQKAQTPTKRMNSVHFQSLQLIDQYGIAQLRLNDLILGAQGINVFVFNNEFNGFFFRRETAG